MPSKNSSSHIWHVTSETKQNTHTFHLLN